MLDVTLIITLYNSKEFIEPLVTTILNQTVKFKVIFIDDCSTDSTVETLIEAVRYSGIEYDLIINEANMGPGYSRNHAVDFVTSKYFTFLDGDDVLSSNFIEDTYILAEKSNAEIVSAKIVRLFNDGSEQDHINYTKYSTANKNERACLLLDGPCGELFNKEFWIKQKVSFPENIKAEDLSIMPILHSNANNIEYEPNSIYYYVQTKHSRSRGSGDNYLDIITATNNLLNFSDRMNMEILKYKITHNILYGSVMSAIIFGVSDNEIKGIIEQAMTSIGYSKSKYEYLLPLKKRVFIILSRNRKTKILKIMINRGRK